MDMTDIMYLLYFVLIALCEVIRNIKRSNRPVVEHRRLRPNNLFTRNGQNRFLSPVY